METNERAKHAAMCVACRARDGFSIENLDVVTHEMDAGRDSWYRLETPRSVWEPYLEQAILDLAAEMKKYGLE